MVIGLIKIKPITFLKRLSFVIKTKFVTQLLFVADGMAWAICEQSASQPCFN